MQLQENQRRVSLTYDSMDTLMSREEYMKNTLQNYLDRNGNQQEITDQYISTTENKYLLNFILSPVN